MWGFGGINPYIQILYNYLTNTHYNIENEKSQYFEYYNNGPVNKRQIEYPITYGLYIDSSFNKCYIIAVEYNNIFGKDESKTGVDMSKPTSIKYYDFTNNKFSDTVPSNGDITALLIEPKLKSLIDYTNKTIVNIKISDVVQDFNNSYELNQSVANEVKQKPGNVIKQKIPEVANTSNENDLKVEEVEEL